MNHENEFSIMYTAPSNVDAMLLVAPEKDVWLWRPCQGTDRQFDRWTKFVNAAP